MPKVADGTRVGWLDPAAPWSAEIGVDPMARTLSAALLATVEVLYDDDRADLRQVEVVECVLHPLGDPVDLDCLRMVDHDPRDVRSEAPDRGVVPPARRPDRHQGLRDVGAEGARRPPRRQPHHDHPGQPRAEALQPAG
jgi:hypothetical protein